MLPIEVPELYDEIEDVPHSLALNLAPGPAGITITAGPIALRVMMRLATRFTARREQAIPLHSRRATRRHGRYCTPGCQR